MVLPFSATDTTGTISDNALNWYFGHGSTNQLDSDGTHTWPPNNGEDTVHYTVLVEAGIGTCTDTETVTVSVAPAPFVQTVGGEVCSGTSFSFQGNAFNLGAQGEWFWEVDNVWSGAAQDYGTITSDFEGFSYTFENPDLLTDTVTIDSGGQQVEWVLCRHFRNAIGQAGIPARNQRRRWLHSLCFYSAQPKRPFRRLGLW